MGREGKGDVRDELSAGCWQGWRFQGRGQGKWGCGAVHWVGRRVAAAIGAGLGAGGQRGPPKGSIISFFLAVPLFFQI